MQVCYILVRCVGCCKTYILRMMQDVLWKSHLLLSHHFKVLDSYGVVRCEPDL